MFFYLALAAVYLYALFVAVIHRQRNALLFWLALPVGAYLFFGPR